MVHLMNEQRWWESSPWLPQGMLKHYVNVLKAERKKQWVKKVLRLLSYFGCNVYFLHTERFFSCIIKTFIVPDFMAMILTTKPPSDHASDAGWGQSMK